MVDAVNSGYKSAAQTITWTANGPDSLANGAWSDLSDVIDNSSLKNLFMDLTFSLTFGTTAATSGESVALYLVPQVEDNTDPNWTGGDVATEEEENEQYYIGSVTVVAETDPQVHNLRSVAMPPGLFKIGVRNNAATGDTTAATLKYRPWNYASQ